MCFCVLKNQRVKTAKEDIVCYKIIHADLRSNMQLFQYEYGKTYKIKKFPEYIKIPDFYSATPHHWSHSTRIINEGFHSYITLPPPPPSAYGFKLLVECIIPKGSRYHFNKKHNEYVSNSIKIVKKLN